MQEWIAADAVRRRLWTRAVFAFGKIRAPLLRPRLTFDDSLRVHAAVRHGDVVAGYTRRYASSAMIPGRYKHTGIYVGHGYVVHAVAPRVCKIPLRDFVLEYDRAAVWRPKYPGGESWKATDRAAFCQLGAGYDAFYCDNNGLWYCHEFVAHCLEAVGLIVPKRGPQYLADDIHVVCDTILEVGR